MSKIREFFTPKNKTEKVLAIVLLVVLGIAILGTVLTVGIIPAIWENAVTNGNGAYKIVQNYDGEYEIWYFVSDNTKGDFVCPEKFLFWDVVSLSTVAECREITSITLSSGIESFIPAFIVQTKLEAYYVAEGNKHYCAENGVLYNKDCTVLLAYPHVKVGDVYELPMSVTEIGGGSFMYSENLRTLVIRNDSQVIDLWGNEFRSYNTLTIYVPDNLVEQYKSTDGWKEYADYIFPLSTFEN